MSENDAIAEAVPPKLSRYRSTRGGTTNVEMATPPAPVNSVELNPSLARSRSRYRRNRPLSNGNIVPPTPAIPGHARIRPVRGSQRPATSHPLAPQSEEEAHTRELHRQGAMEQLTGGNNSAQHTGQPQVPASSRPAVQQPRSQPAPAHPPRSSNSGNDGNRKSFFQKVKLSRSAKKNEPSRTTLG
jgi:hypothetical protein